MLLSEVIWAQLLLFERPARSQYDSATGARMIVGFVILAGAVHPGARELARQTLPGGVGPFVVLALMLGSFVVWRELLNRDARVIGLYRWREWTARERLYVLTVVPIVVVGFTLMFQAHLGRIIKGRGLLGFVLISVPLGLLWGFLQEVIYRGLLQTETTHRLGGVAGVVIGNFAFTFGPLHSNYLGLSSNSGPNWGMLAAIFAIGLFFGALYHRSGNLWLPAILHAIWPLNVS